MGSQGRPLDKVEAPEWREGGHMDTWGKTFLAAPRANAKARGRSTLGMLKTSKAAGAAGVARSEGSVGGDGEITQALQVTARTLAFPLRREAVGGG